jgi:N-acetylglutamate synthase-like GNAT family acetyltransferase
VAEVGQGISLDVRHSSREDLEWIAELIDEYWGSATVVSRGSVHEPSELPGLVAFKDGFRCGLLTYRVEGAECEIVTLNSLLEGEGVGTALVSALREEIRETGCRRLWVITTNDNMDALRFYQKRGFAITAIHRGAMEESRRLKPHIPLMGRDGIPVRDEIELELVP